MLMSIELPFPIRETQFPILGSVTILCLKFRALYGVRLENCGTVYLVIYLKKSKQNEKPFVEKYHGVPGQQ